MNRNLALAVVAFVSFTAFTVIVGVEHGMVGFVPLVLEGGWGLQMFLDIAVGLSIASFWIVADARKHGINPWPFLFLCLPLGSIGALAYLVYRGIRLRGSVGTHAATARTA